MRVTGPLSNPRTMSRLEAAARAHSRIGQAPCAGQALTRRALRLSMGAIQTAVLEVLAAAGGSLRTDEIHSRVEARLERVVSRDTINSFLSVAARDSQSHVARPARGSYEVRFAVRPSRRGRPAALR